MVGDQHGLRLAPKFVPGTLAEKSGAAIAVTLKGMKRQRS